MNIVFIQCAWKCSQMQYQNWIPLGNIKHNIHKIIHFTPFLFISWGHELWWFTLVYFMMRVEVQDNRSHRIFNIYKQYFNLVKETILLLRSYLERQINRYCHMYAKWGGGGGLLIVRHNFICSPLVFFTYSFRTKIEKRLIGVFLYDK